MARRACELNRAGRPAQLRVLAEVMQVQPDGRALLWMHDQRGLGRDRIRGCRLTPSQTAEAMLCFDDGARPAFEMVFDLDGDGDGGRFDLQRRPAHTRLVVLGALDTLGRLDDLLAA